MKCYLDANVLLYFVFESASRHEDAKNLLLSLRVDDFDLYISPLTIDEFSHQFDYLSRKSSKRRKDYFDLLWMILDTIMKLPCLELVNPPLGKKEQFKLIDLMKKYKLKPRDAYHLLIMLENDIDYVATYDKDFKLAVKSGIIKQYN